jgi:hypothetical protein
MKVYGFSYDGGDLLFFSRGDRDAAVVKEIKDQGGPLVNLNYWEREVPEDLLAQTAYDYITANEIGELR